MNRPNLAQALDTNTIDQLLQQAMEPGSAALTVLKHSTYFNPRQTAFMLEKLPRLRALHRVRYGADWSQEQQQIYQVLMAVLQQRLVDIMPECSPEQLQQALWGLATAGRHWTTDAAWRQGSEEVASGLGAWLATRSSSSQGLPRMQLLSHAAYYLAASRLGSHPTMATTIGMVAVQQQQQKVQGQVQGQGKQDAKGAASRAPAADEAAAPAVVVDHRSICRMAAALAAVPEVPAGSGAWQLLSSRATSLMENLLKGHQPSKGLLQPRRQYLYKTIQGWTKLPKARPYRPSKYLRFNGPRVIVDSFDLSTATSLLSSMAAAGHRDVGLLRAVEKLVTAMMPPWPGAGSSGSGAGSGRALLPGCPGGGLVPDVSGRLLPADPWAPGGWTAVEGDAAPPASLEAGTARAKIGAGLTRGVAGTGVPARLLHGFYTLKYRSPALAAALLRHMQFSRFRDDEADKLAAVAHMAAMMGLQDKAAMARLLAAMLPLASSLSQQHATLLAAACARVGYWPDADPAMAQLLSRVGDVNTGLLSPGVAGLLKGKGQA